MLVQVKGIEKANKIAVSNSFEKPVYVGEIYTSYCFIATEDVLDKEVFILDTVRKYKEFIKYGYYRGIKMQRKHSF